MRPGLDVMLSAPDDRSDGRGGSRPAGGRARPAPRSRSAGSAARADASRNGQGLQADPGRPEEGRRRAAPDLRQRRRRLRPRRLNMAQRSHRRIAAGAALIVIGGLLLSLTSPFGASAATVPPAAIPTHVYSPYFETWTTDTITGIANASGVRYFTLAFLET